MFWFWYRAPQVESSTSAVSIATEWRVSVVKKHAFSWRSMVSEVTGSAWRVSALNVSETLWLIRSLKVSDVAWRLRLIKAFGIAWRLGTSKLVGTSWRKRNGISLTSDWVIGELSLPDPAQILRVARRTRTAIVAAHRRIFLARR